MSHHHVLVLCDKADCRYNIDGQCHETRIEITYDWEVGWNCLSYEGEDEEVEGEKKPT
jgi:hypothetical protein